MIELKTVYAGYGKTEILHGISLAVTGEENLSIIGPNGCGKTTLLRCLAGMLPYRGSILVDGQEINRIRKKELAKKIGLLSQMTQIYFDYSVLETVLMGRYAYEKSGYFGGLTAADRQAAKAALVATGSYELRERKLQTLSGGQRQRVLLARVLAQDPDILLLDEPTNHLDLAYQIELIGFLKAWSQNHQKVVIGVLHDINLAMLLADQVLLLSAGRVKAHGHYQKVFASEALHEVYQMDVSEHMKMMLKRWEQIR